MALYEMQRRLCYIDNLKSPRRSQDFDYKDDETVLQTEIFRVWKPLKETSLSKVTKKH